MTTKSSEGKRIKVKPLIIKNGIGSGGNYEVDQKSLDKGKGIKDATKEKCFRCGKPAYKFVQIIFKPSLWNKPFCKKCLNNLLKECEL